MNENLSAYFYLATSVPTIIDDRVLIDFGEQEFSIHCFSVAFRLLFRCFMSDMDK